MRRMAAEVVALGADLVEGLDEESVSAAGRVLEHVLARLQSLVAEHEAREKRRADSA